MMVPRDSLFSRPLRLLGVNGGGIARVLGGLQQRLDRGLGVIEGDQGSFFSKLTSMFSTPLTLFSAFLIVIGQAAQVMPVTDRVTVCVVAQAGALRGREGDYRGELFHDVFLSVQPRQNVGERKRDPR